MKSKIWPRASKYLPILLAGVWISSVPTLSFAQNSKTEEPPAESAEIRTEETVEVQEPPVYMLELESCAFTAQFPGEPQVSRRCSGETNVQSAKECYDVVSYTQVYDMTTTVDVSFSCNQSTPDAYRQYDEEVMTLALKAMGQRRSLEDAQINFQDRESYKQAALSGNGVTGRQVQVYIAQLWVAPESVLSVEAQLIGGQHYEADKEFSKILKSIKVKE